MGDAVLALNAGSSSLKFSLFDLAHELRSERAVAHGAVTGIPEHPRLEIYDGQGNELANEALSGGGAHDVALEHLVTWIDRNDSRVRIAAAGHRVVHGGERFVEPTRVDDAVIAGLRALIPLAPLHEEHNIAAIEAFAAHHPHVPQVACFDTAFHRTQPAIATAFALPRALSERGIRRYGFHGLSYEYIASQLPAVLGDRPWERVIVAHLGSGASLCALKNGASIATTMSFTALDGLPMGTRCGALDPGVVLYLLGEGMSGAQLRDLLWEQSGLLGVSGISSDVHELLESTEQTATEAIALFVYRCVREIGSLAAALGGLDALVFTAGIGEHAASIRAAICAELEWLHVRLDDGANRANAQRIEVEPSPVAVLVIPTDEESVVARQTAQVVGLMTVQRGFR